MYKFTVCLVLGCAGFGVNLLGLGLATGGVPGGYRLGLVFPLLAGMAWGWPWGLLSGTLGLGFQNGWWSGEGWEHLVTMPLLCLWVVWHSLAARSRRRGKRLWNSPYVAEIPFRLAYLTLIFLLFPLAAGDNPPPWNPDAWRALYFQQQLHALAVQEVLNAYLMLLSADVALRLNSVRRLLGRPPVDSLVRTGLVMGVAFLFGAGFWVLDSFLDYSVFYLGQASLADLGLFNVPAHEVYVRTTFLLASLAGGLIFCRLLAGLRRRDLFLAQSEEMFRTVAHFTTDWVYWQGEKGDLIYVSPSVQAVTGHSARELQKRPESLLELVHPADRRLFEDHQKDERRELSPGAELEFRIVTRDGRVRWIGHRCQPVYGPDGTWRGRRVGNRDITAQRETREELARLNRELEKRVSERTAQLEAANRELESFSYSVSHDLRAPLRSIDGFSQALVEDYGPLLEGSAQDYLRRIRRASQRMGQLIDDVLGLSRLTRREMAMEEMDLSAMARETAEALRESKPGFRVDFSVEPGLRARGDGRLVRIVLEKLLGNAWKFTAKEDAPRVEVGMLEPGQAAGAGYEGRKVFFVADNGAGFDMAYADKLFGAFQRLHHESDFPGNGIGLATVQRIVNRHGGAVWAEGEVGRGARFFFTLDPEGSAVRLKTGLCEDAEVED